MQLPKARGGRLAGMEHIFAIFHWLIILAVFGSRKIADLFNNFRGGGRGGGPHPLPATGGVESSRGSANPKESRPVGPDRRQWPT